MREKEREKVGGQPPVDSANFQNLLNSSFSLLSSFNRPLFISPSPFTPRRKEQLTEFALYLYRITRFVLSIKLPIWGRRDPQRGKTGPNKEGNGTHFCSFNDDVSKNTFFYTTISRISSIFLYLVIQLDSNLRNTKFYEVGIYNWILFIVIKKL